MKCYKKQKNIPIAWKVAMPIIILAVIAVAGSTGIMPETLDLAAISSLLSRVVCNPAVTASRQ